MIRFIFISTLILFVSTNGRSQLPRTRLFKIGFSWNESLVNPETNNLFSKKHAEDITSTHYGVSLQLRLMNRPRFRWFSGVGYRNLSYSYVDQIASVVYTNYSNLQLNTYNYTDFADLLLRSKTFTLVNSVEFRLNEAKMKNQFIGLSIELHLAEQYSRSYHTTDPPFYTYMNAGEYVDYSLPGYATTLKNRLFEFNYAVLSAQYHYYFPTKGALKPSVNISLGTHLYSDWDQFSKYVWLGVGTEVGFQMRNKHVAKKMGKRPSEKLN